jgi:hypothetical protein
VRDRPRTGLASRIACAAERRGCMCRRMASATTEARSSSHPCSRAKGFVESAPSSSKHGGPSNRSVSRCHAASSPRRAVPGRNDTPSRSAGKHAHANTRIEWLRRNTGAALAPARARPCRLAWPAGPAPSGQCASVTASVRYSAQGGATVPSKGARAGAPQVHRQQGDGLERSCGASGREGTYPITRPVSWLAYIRCR